MSGQVGAFLISASGENAGRVPGTTQLVEMAAEGSAYWMVKFLVEAWKGDCADYPPKAVYAASILLLLQAPLKAAHSLKMHIHRGLLCFSRNAGGPVIILHSVTHAAASDLKEHHSPCH